MYTQSSPGGNTTSAPVGGSGFYDGNGHPLSCPDTCPSNTPTTDQREDNLRTLINSYRLQNSLPSLGQDQVLDEAARAEVKHQVIHSYTGLVNPEGDDVNGRLSRVGATSTTASENQVVGGINDTAQTIFNSMTADPVMNANLLDANADNLGVGYTNTMDNNGRTSVIINHTN